MRKPVSDILNRPLSRRTNTFFLAMTGLALLAAGMSIGVWYASHVERTLQAHMVLGLERDAIKQTLGALALLRGGEPDTAAQLLEISLHDALVVFEPVARQLYGDDLPASLVGELEQVQQYRVAYPFMTNHPIQEYLDSFEGTSTNTAGLPPVIFPVIARRTTRDAFDAWTLNNQQTNGPTCKVRALRDGTFTMDVYGVVSSNHQDTLVETLGELSPYPSSVVFWKSEPEMFGLFGGLGVEDALDADPFEMWEREVIDKRIREVVLSE